MVEKTPPIGAVTNISWSGNTLRTTTRGAFVETMQFDGSSRPFLKTRNGIRTAYGSDPLSGPILKSLPGQVFDQRDGTLRVAGTLLDRDILGRVTGLMNADASRRSLSRLGKTVTETDELSRTTTYRYFAYADPSKHQLVETDRADKSKS